MKGLPSAWLHANDELYSNLRGPAKGEECVGRLSRLIAGAGSFSGPSCERKWVRATAHTRSGGYCGMAGKDLE